MPLGLAGADRTGDGHRLFGHRRHLTAVVRQHEDSGVAGQHLGPVRPTVARPAPGATASSLSGRPSWSAAHRKWPSRSWSRPARTGSQLGVDLVESEADVGHGAVEGAGEVLLLGGVGQQLHLAERRALRRIGHRLPQLEGPLVVAHGLGRRRHPLGGQPRLDRGGQGQRQVAGPVPVVGQGGGGDGTAGVVGGQGLGDAGVDPAPLARAAARRRPPPAPARDGSSTASLPGSASSRLASTRLRRIASSSASSRALTSRSRRSSTRTPRAAASRRTSWSASDRWAKRPITMSRRLPGRAPPPLALRRHGHAAPRRRRGCPRSGSSARRASRGAAGAPVMASTCSASSARVNEARSRRVVVPERSSSARTGRSGWRRWSSSLRTVAHHHHPTGHVALEERDQVEGGAIRPVEVLDHQQDGGGGGEVADQTQQQLEQAPGRRQGRGGREVLAQQAGHQRAQLGHGRAERCSTCSAPTWSRRRRRASTTGAKGTPPFAQLDAPPGEDQEAAAGGPLGSPRPPAGTCRCRPRRR